MTGLTQSSGQSWRDTLQRFLHPRVVTMLFLGFSAGIPILLIFSTLSLWLREAGVSRAEVTFFSWAALGYSFKFVWAPLVDRLPLPWLGRALGRRRSWILLSQFAVIAAILWMGLTDPASGSGSLVVIAMAAVMLGFSSATQDIVIDAYRIESAGQELQALMSATYIAGYRIGMLVAGAGALFLADYLGTSLDTYHYDAWRWTYIVVAASMLIGIVTTLSIPEPQYTRQTQQDYSSQDYLRFLLLFVCAVLVFVSVFFFSKNLSVQFKDMLHAAFDNRALAGFLIETLRLACALGAAFLVGSLLARIELVSKDMLNATYVEPVRDFFKRYGLSVAVLLLALIATYRISDIVLGVISNVFYQDLGFSKTDIGKVVKTFGLLMTIVGGFLGGVLSLRYGVMRILLTGAVLAAATNLLFLLLASTGHNMFMLYLVIAADNLTAGLASAAFVAFLSSLTNVSFTAVQYAVFSSLMTLLPKMVGGYSGAMVDSMGYPWFFVVTAILGIPALVLVIIAGRKLELKEPQIKA